MKTILINWDGFLFFGLFKKSYFFYKIIIDYSIYKNYLCALKKECFFKPK